MDINLPVTPSILRKVAWLDRFRGAWEAAPPLPLSQLQRLRGAATVRSVGASCRLDGIHITEAEVAEMLSGLVPAGTTGTGEILGLARALDAPFPARGPLVTPEEIGRLHALLLGAGGDDPDATPWRSDPLHLEAFDASGTATGRIFQTLPPRMVAQKVDELSTWFELEYRSGDHHPLLVISVFILAFLTASPFDRANGRMARLMARQLYMRAGYTHLPYASLEAVIEEERDAYHDALDEAQTRLWAGGANLEPWLEFCLQALRVQADRVFDRIELERKAADLSPLQRAIVETVQEHGTAGAGLLLEATGANRNTLKDNLRRLVERGRLERMGRRRGTLYRLPMGKLPGTD